MRKMIFLGCGLILIGLLCWVSISAGAVSIPANHILKGLMNRGDSSYFIVHEVRLPRVLVAIWAGIGLAVSGAILQALLINPLSSPDVIGVTQGAGFAAVAALFLMPGISAGMLSIAAFAGALLSFVILFLMTRRLTISHASLALVGVAIGAIFQTGIQYFMVTYPTNVNMALLWMSGSLWGRGWEQAMLLIPIISLLSIIAMANAQKLNLLQLGDDLSLSFGLRVRSSRIGLLLLAVSMAGVTVAAVGAIGFVGLLAPHIAKLLVGTRKQWHLPMAAVIGANLMLLGDVLGRTLIIPREIPVGILTAIIGAPYFIYLLRKERKMK